MAQKSILHFAHANGFPAGTYRKLLDLLNPDYTVIAIEKLGHNPDYPVDDNWPSLVNELIDYVKSNASEPVIGVGHSLGSVLTFLAAYNHPDLFRKLIMLDPPLIFGFPAFLFYLSKKTGLLNRSREVSHTKKRRTDWSSRGGAEEYFKGKPLFSRFDPDCLRDYVQYGTSATETGVALNFDINVESNIFRTTPHNISSLKRSLGIPGAVILGKDTYGPSHYMLSRFTKRHRLHFQQLDYGTHLFPLEYPERTADLIKKFGDL